MNEICVNFDEVTGNIKPLHGVGCAPYVKSMGPNQRYIERLFKEGNIPYSRLHDCCGTYGGSYYVDISNVFPDFQADENNPASYDFHYTDEYIGAIQATGCEVYYRLGETIEWGSKKYTAHPPADFEKWAKICEHIIRHYNEGWAEGYFYNITYWEIWNEPENPGDAWGRSQWTGTQEEFFTLYEIASKHLKTCFPQIKVGGYGSCGFYAITRDNMPKSYQRFVTWFTDFLVFVKEHDCPLDFYSWHIYTGDEQELLAHAKYVRETLDQYGYADTEAHLNSGIFQAEGAGFREKHTMEGGSFNAAVMSLLQNTRYVDKAMYYCFSAVTKYNGFFDQNDNSICPPWYSHVAFGHLYRLGKAVQVQCDGDGVYATAAKNDEEYGILVANYNGAETETLIRVQGTAGEKTASILFIDEKHQFEEVFSFRIGNENTLKFELPKQTVVYVKVK